VPDIFCVFITTGVQRAVGAMMAGLDNLRKIPITVEIVHDFQGYIVSERICPMISKVKAFML
jgi:hypothetical protein